MARINFIFNWHIIKLPEINHSEPELRAIVFESEDGIKSLQPTPNLNVFLLLKFWWPYIDWNFSNHRLSPNFINLSSAVKRPSRPLAILNYFPITLCLVKQLKHMPYHFLSKRISLKVKKLVSKLLLLSKYSKLFTLDNCFINHVFIGSFAFALISFRNGRTHWEHCISQLDYLDPDFLWRFSFNRGVWLRREIPNRELIGTKEFTPCAKVEKKS